MSSLDTKVHLAADKVAAEALNKFVVFPENYLSGEIDRLALEGSGTIDAPRTWHRALSLQLSDVHRPAINFDRAVATISAERGRGGLQSGDITKETNEVHLRGSMDLPATFGDFARTLPN